MRTDSTENNPTPIQILLVEDDQLLRRGLRILIENHKRYKVCGEAENASVAAELALTLKPDIALVDLTLKGSTGFDLLKELQRLAPKLPALVLSLHSEEMYAASALRAGAKGFLKKEDVMKHLDEALQCILGGKIWVSELMRRKLPEFL